MTALLVALCGGLGSVSRYLLGRLIERLGGREFPWSTLTVNVLGSLAFGVVVALFAARAELDQRSRIVITSGFLGGFTTYSSFAYETVSFAERGAILRAAIYVAVTLVACGLACASGLWLVRRLG